MSQIRHTVPGEMLGRIPFQAVLRVLCRHAPVLCDSLMASARHDDGLIIGSSPAGASHIVYFLFIQASIYIYPVIQAFQKKGHVQCTHNPRHNGCLYGAHRRGRVL